MLLLAALASALAAAVTVLGYLRDWPLAFHGGLLCLAAGLGFVSLRAARSGRTAAVLVLNTIIFTSVALVAAEGIQRVWPGPSDEDLDQAWSFAAARGDPARFARWWDRYVRAWEETRAGCMMDDPRGVNPFVPRPGARCRFMDAEVRINSRGFRGPEIAADKDGRFRIVALGESTTFGSTIHPGDRPWPELLQEAIASRLDCDAPVEVVNAGIPGWTIRNNNARLQSDILPLEPDMILSYHGYNGFAYLMSELPAMTAEAAPRAPERPSQLLRRVETALLLRRFRRRYEAARAAHTPDISPAELLRTPSADAYRTLARFARAHGIALVVATFNLAANEGTPEEVIRFFELAFPDVRARIASNRLHTRLVRELAPTERFRVIDTSYQLDGRYDEMFHDIMHFTQAGRERFVENLMVGLEPILEDEPPGCRARAS